MITNHFRSMNWSCACGHLDRPKITSRHPEADLKQETTMLFKVWIWASGCNLVPNDHLLWRLFAQTRCIEVKDSTAELWHTGAVEMPAVFFFNTVRYRSCIQVVYCSAQHAPPEVRSVLIWKWKVQLTWGRRALVKYTHYGMSCDPLRLLRSGTLLTDGKAVPASEWGPFYWR